MKFIEIKDVHNNNCVIFTDKIIYIREGNYTRRLKDDFRTEYEAFSAVYTLCANDVEVITYESIDSIMDKIKKQEER